MDREELLAAGDRNLAATLVHAARSTAGASYEDDGRLLLVSTSPTWPAPYQNGALRLDPSMDPDVVLERAASFFSGRAPGYCIWIAAHADADLERAALDAGYVAVSDTGAPRMALEHPIGPPSPPAGVTLDEVVDDAGRRDFLAVTAEAYAEEPLPSEVAEAQLATMEAVRAGHVRAVVARDRGAPVAAALTVLAGGVAGIQMVGTVPAARGRGLAEMCTRWAAGTGFAMGGGAVVLEASAQGEPLYRRLGFVEVSRYRWCFGPPPLS